MIHRYNDFQLHRSTGRQMVLNLTRKNIVFAVSLLALAACGGGGGAAPGGGTTNRAPIANAGPDQAVAEQSLVTLDGTASRDPDGDNLTYTWTQTVGTVVAITNGDMPTASFEAPAVGAGGETLTFQLAVNDGTATATDTIEVAVSEAAAAVNISGKVQYEFVPPNFNCNGLNFLLTETRPIRAATVQLIDDATGNVLDSMVASDSGDYVFNNVSGNLDVRIRIRAELKRSGAPSWDVEVRDNIDDPLNPLPLASRPLYAYEEIFNSGGSDLVRNVTATTGWGVSSYTGPRAAAPFAILDAIYSGMQLVLSADATADFGPLDAFWSVNNTLTSPTDIDAGELPTSFYRGDIDSLFLLGDADTDAEEFDDHVSIHEWGHYFEDVFSRSDSMGGSHSLGESLDPRIAFGEGFAHALAAMATDEPQYCDTNASGGFGFNTETNNSGLQGWFNELSVATLVYDLWDTDEDGSDNDSIGFGPIYETMIGPQANADALTSVFSFAAGLRPMLTPSELAFVDSQLGRENIDTPTVVDQWGDSQTTAPTNPQFPDGRDLIPIYSVLPTNGTPVNVCLNNDYFVADDVPNKLGMFRYFRFTTTGTSSYTITATANPAPTATTGAGDPAPRDDSDPDMYLHRSGQEFPFASSTDDGNAVEVFDTPSLTPGTYILRLLEWRHVDEDAAADFPTQVCFDVTLN